MLKTEGILLSREDRICLVHLSEMTKISQLHFLSNFRVCHLWFHTYVLQKSKSLTILLPFANHAVKNGWSWTIEYSVFIKTTKKDFSQVLADFLQRDQTKSEKNTLGVESAWIWRIKFAICPIPLSYLRDKRESKRARKWFQNKQMSKRINPSRERTSEWITEYWTRQFYLLSIQSWMLWWKSGQNLRIKFFDILSDWKKVSQQTVKTGFKQADWTWKRTRF